MQALKFENVYFSYSEDGAEAKDDWFTAESSFCLQGIDFSMEEGEFVAVLGHNGSGKSTFARLSNGLLSPKSGKITVFGLDAGEEKNLFDIRKQVGIVFQNPDNQTVASIVEDDIAFGPENVGIAREEIGKRIDFALQAVGMSDFRTSTTTRLSGGQKQRIAIAGVLALKPRLMILDESTAMLDPRGRKEVMDVVRKLNKEEGISVMLITHFPEEAMLADRVIVMNEGRIVMSGVPEEIFKDEKELETYKLKTPRGVQISQKLRLNSVSVGDGFDVESLADEIARLVPDCVKNQKKNGAGVGLSEYEESIAGVKKSVVCKNLHYVYNPKSPFSTHALNRVDLEISEGEFFGIIGHTGSGKSTFVQHLNALLKLPTAEKKYKPKKKNKSFLNPTVLRVSGFDLTDKKTDFKALRQKVGMVFQYPEYQLFAETVFEDVAFGLKNFQKDVSQEELENSVRFALETVGLDYDQVKNRSPFDLSGGQKRRVAIAGVIVTKPEILVLDEPAAGLDPLGKEEIMSLLHRIHDDWCKTVIIVSHDMDEIAENCSRAAIFSEGKILSVGSPTCLFAKESLIEEAGLDVPFTAKITRALKEKGVEIVSDFTMADFVKQTLALLKTTGAGTGLTEGGRSDA